MRTWTNVAHALEPRFEFERNSPDSELSSVRLYLGQSKSSYHTMSWTELDNLHDALNEVLAEHEERKAAQLALYDQINI